MKLHIDTDLGGDIDDFCALAMLLRWPGVELTGITTVAEVGSKRAGYVRHVLALEHREEIPVAAGADASLRPLRWEQVLLDEQAYWGETIPPSPNPLDQALTLLKRSIEQGATIVGIGPFTNLYLLEQRYPGILRAAPLVLMGGYVHPIPEGFPQWGNDLDYNVQADAQAAQSVLAASNPTLVTLSTTVQTALRLADLERLKGAGALGRRVAQQAAAFAIQENYAEKLGSIYPRVPAGFINFLHDPLACAIAAGWNEGVETLEVPLRLNFEEGRLHERIDPAGKPVMVVTQIDAEQFNRFWLDTVCGVT